MKIETRIAAGVMLSVVCVMYLGCNNQTQSNTGMKSQSSDANERGGALLVSNNGCCHDLVQARKMVIRGLEDTDAGVRTEAAERIYNCKIEMPEAMPLLIDMSESGNREERLAACLAIGLLVRTGNANATTLARLLDDQDDIVRKTAFGVLCSVNVTDTDVSDEMLLYEAECDSPLSPKDMIRWAKNAGENEMPIASSLVEADVPFVIYRLTRYFARYRLAAKSIVPRLVKNLSSDDAALSAFSAKALWQITQDANVVTPTLRSIIIAKEFRSAAFPKGRMFIKKTCAKTLGEMGDQAFTVLMELERLARSESDDCMCAEYKSLVRIIRQSIDSSSSSTKPEK